MQLCIKKELESLTGKLQHVCTVVKPGQSLLALPHRDSGRDMEGPHPSLYSSQVRCYLVGYLPGIVEWGLHATTPHSTVELGSHHEYTDAVGSFGCGAIRGTQWLKYAWPQSFGGKAIATLELLPTFQACMI